MNRTRPLPVAFTLLSLALPAATAAQPQASAAPLTFEFTREQAGTYRCSATNADSAQVGDPLTFLVRAAVADGDGPKFKPSSYTITRSSGTSPARAFAPTDDPALLLGSASIQPGDAFWLTVTVEEPADEDGTPAETKVSCLATAPTGERVADLDARAYTWWKRQGDAALGSLGPVAVGSRGVMVAPKKLKYLVYLPSGAPAFPFSTGFSERDQLQVLVITADANSMPISVSVDTCNGAKDFRVRPGSSGSGSGEKEAAAIIEKKLVETARDEGAQREAMGVVQAFQSGPTDAALDRLDKLSWLSKTDKSLLKDAVAARDAFSLTPVGSWFRCGPGHAAITLQANEGPLTSTRLNIRPVYHVAPVALLGYDTTSKVGYERARGTATADDPTPADTIQKVQAARGPSFYLGAQWMVAGADYGKMDWGSRVANLFLGVNPAAPLEDAVAGLALTLTGGVSLALGASYHRGTRLKAGWKVGDAAPDGDIPTTRDYADGEIGGFVGLAVDTHVFEALEQTAQDSDGDGGN